MSKSLFGNEGELFLYNDKNIKFAVAESFSAQLINQTLATPARFICAEIVSGSKVHLTLHGVTITDEEAVRQMEKSALGGDMPILNFQGYLKRRDEIQERIIFRNLIQTGSIDLNDGYVGVWTFRVNDPKSINYFK